MVPDPRPERAHFLRHLADERGLSAHTVDAYARDLAQLEDFLTDYLGGEGWTWDDPEVDRLAVRGFLGWCERRGLSRRSSARKLSAARAFFRFLHLEERIPANPTRAVRTPKAEKRLPGHLSEPDARLVMEAAESAAAGNDLRGTRGLVVLELLYGSGLRLSELHGLDLAAIERGRRQARVTGKGRKERIVPITEAALRAIDRYQPRRAEVVAVGIRRAPGQHPGRAAVAEVDPADRPRCPGGRRRRARALDALAPPLVRDAPPERRSGPPGRQGAARARVPLHDADLHPHFQGAAASRLPGRPPPLRVGLRATLPGGAPRRLPYRQRLR